MSDQSKELKLVQSAVDGLGEHFESVQVFVTRHDQGEAGGTIRIIKGCGNWFARYGQVREWLIREEETSRLQTRRDNEDSV